ncbi:MAG: NmrA family NAD(P)-binding protein [Saprospiraceae bacterium]|nr:NmrA family NAD(P)-binding protein [Saprospiraceae bacterium]
MKQTVVVAGGTGNLGERIIKSLVEKGAEVHAIVRSESNVDKIRHLEKLGAKVFIVDMLNTEAVARVCEGASCVVSALAGLRDVVVDAQKVLLDGAVAAKVPRFIPSDYSIDFTDFPAGGNRNLDLRREFHEYLDKQPIKATTIFIGAFAELLTSDMPLILLPLKRILYWGNADVRMDFTTISNTAEFTANAALDPSTPRYLRVAGDRLSAREMSVVVGEVTRQKFGLFRAGGLGRLSTIIKIARTIAPGTKELYPAWQGMQYMRNMMDGRAISETNNDRYPGMHWTTVRDFISAHQPVTA